MFYVEVKLPTDQLKRRVILDDASDMAFNLGTLGVRLLTEPEEAMEFDFANTAKGMEFMASLRSQHPLLPILVYST